MSGEKELTKPASVEEQNEEIEKLIQSYEAGLGIRNTNPDIKAERYLTMSEDDLKCMNGEDAARASIVLAQYSFYLQRSHNTETRRVNWATAKLDRAVLAEMKNYSAGSAPERRMMAIKENQHAIKLEQLRGLAQSRADQINYLSAKVDALSYRFSEYQQSKRAK